MPDAPGAGSVFVELGQSGLKQSYGYVQEEYLPTLRGTNAVKVYEEMSTDAIVGAVLYAIEMMMRRVPWTVQGPHTDFIEDCRQDMSHSWEDFMAEAMSVLPFGWAYHEICYKQRPDGMIGWKKLPIRGQNTLNRWEIDAQGGIKGMWQSCGGHAIFLPIEKCLHFRTSQRRNNPEGRAILRTAYTPWWYRKRIREIEAVGVERDACGIPVAEVPAEWAAAESGSDGAAAFLAYKDIVTNLRNDEQAGVVLGQAYDEFGNPLVKLSLLNSGGRRNFDTGNIISRYALEIAQSVLFDVILMGHEKVGSYALASTKDDLAVMGLEAQVEQIARVFNKFAIPRLLELNGLSNDPPTTLVPGDLMPLNLEAVIDAVWKLAQAGAPLFPDEALTNHLRRLLGLPEDTSADALPLPMMQQAASMTNDDSPGDAAPVE